MKTIFLTLLVLHISNALFSQDTIRFIDKTFKVVKVSEVGINEIKYHRFDNLEGPLYVSSKTEIESITYANGHTDSFKSSVQQAPIVTSTPINTYKAPISNEKIVITPPRLFYGGKPLGETRLYRMINNYPEGAKKTLLLKEFEVLRTFKKKQYVFGFVGLGAGVGLAYVGSMLSIVSGEPAPIAIGFAGGLTIGGTGAVLSYLQKQKRLKKKYEIADIYNN